LIFLDRLTNFIQEIEAMMDSMYLTPRQIVEELDKYIYWSA